MAGGCGARIGGPAMSVNHRAEAERHLADAARHLAEFPAQRRAELAAVIGQGHAALAANTANDDLRDTNRQLRTDLHAMRRWVSGHIAHALVSGNPERWRAARELAQGLDSADVNVDALIEQHLADDGHDPKTAFNTPFPAGSDRDPWAPDPSIEALVAVRSVVAGHLAEMFLDGKCPEAHQWARGIAQELKLAGVDIDDDIVARLRSLTLGPRPAEEAPF